MGSLRDIAAAELALIDRAGLRRVLEPVTGRQGPLVELGGRQLVNFSSNDYLSLAGHPKLVAAAKDALERYGAGAGASRLIVGHSAAHASLEEALAKFEGTEAALLFNSGFTANLGVLTTVVGPGDAVFSDALNHASIVDGCRMSRATVHVYRHLDLAHLEVLLAGERTARRRLIVTDTLFSMDGDVAPLKELCALAKRYGAMLMVDEAHATGVFGPRGAGVCEALGVEKEVELRIGTLGKALGSFGAYVACDRVVADWLLNRARSLIFTTGLPPPVCAASEAAVQIVHDEPGRRAHLWRLAARLAKGLEALGFDAAPRSHLFPVVLGEPSVALAAAAALRERGYLVKAIRPPTVPEGTSRLRIGLCAGHTEAHVDGLLDALAAFAPSRGTRAAGVQG